MSKELWVLKVVDVRIYLGPSVYAPERSTIKPQVETGDDDVVNVGKYRKILSELQSHLDLKEPNFEKREDGFPLWPLLPNLTAALLTEATGNEHKVVRSIEKIESCYEYVIEMDTEKVASNAAYDAVYVLNAMNADEPVDFGGIIETLERDYYKYSLGPSTDSIVSAADEKGIPSMRLNDYSLVQLGYGAKNRKIEATTTDATSFVGMKIAQLKSMTKDVLKMGGLPVPEGSAVETWDEGKAVIEDIDGSFAIKPVDSSKGRGATTNLRSVESARKAFDSARNFSDQVLIEEHVEGRDYRVLVVGKKVVAVSERKPASVTGDGEHTVEELIDEVNADPMRGEGHELPLTKITIDEQTRLCLRKQQLNLDSTPEQGRKVILKTTANLSTGGVAIDKTDEIHPVNETIAIRAARLLGMDVCGVDVIAPNVTESWYQNGGRIIEINASPGLRMHIHPRQGKAREPGKAIVSQLFPDEKDSRIPIIPITGTNGKTTTTLLVSHILRLAGYDVGTTTTEGIYVRGSRILQCDCTGPWSAEVILKDATTDAAVLETARGGILKRGLGFDQADISTVLNVTEEHLGEHGIETVEGMAEVKGLLYEVTHPDGWAVVNCDDDLVWEQSERFGGKKIGFSQSPQNQRLNKFKDEDLPYVTIRDETISIHDGQRLLPLVAVDSVPITFEGIADFNIENALAATAIAHAMDVSLDTIRAGLLSFAPTPELNPGRSNMLRIGSFNVFIDYAHNKAAMELVSKFLFKLKKRWGLARLTGAICLPGNRRDTEYREIMKIVADTFDKVYLKEDKNTRGRERGELAQILQESLLSAGMSEKDIHSYSIEPGAIKRALQNSVEDELIFVNFESFETVYDAISEYRNQEMAGGRGL
ncbi:MAG: cyanophycin synthetase [Candidatus Lokiarchaeota archaeon]|nr:cyanophycin synthetase [Candidatus Lokiarchaeota archaeon]